MLLAWTFVALTTVLEVHYCTGSDPRVNSFSRPLDALVISLFLVAILTCGGCRFWLSRMRRPGWALIPYFLGLVFSWFTAMYGVFVLPEFALLFEGMGAVSLFFYFPVLVRLASSPPPVPQER